VIYDSHLPGFTLRIQSSGVRSNYARPARSGSITLGKVGEFVTRRRSREVPEGTGQRRAWASPFARSSVAVARSGALSHYHDGAPAFGAPISFVRYRFFVRQPTRSATWSIGYAAQGIVLRLPAKRMSQLRSRACEPNKAQASTVWKALPARWFTRLTGCPASCVNSNVIVELEVYVEVPPEESSRSPQCAIH
jgi:hypothetical protein